MKFYLKMTLSMLALLSLLFGIGGSLLISGSFQNSLEREKVAAFGDYRMAWGTLQIVNSRDPYLDREAIARVMEQLYQQNSAAWASLRLSTETQILCETGEDRSSLLAGDGVPGPGGCLFRIAEGPDGRRYLTFSGAVETNGDILYLAASHDITALYTARQTQQRMHS